MNTRSHRWRSQIVDILMQHFPSGWEATIKTPKEGFWDRVIRFPGEGPRIGLILRKDPKPMQFPFGVEQDSTSQRAVAPLLGAPIVTPRLREVLEQNNWGWSDMAGNISISLPAPARLLIQKLGNPPIKYPSTRPRLDSPEAAKVMRVILHPENTNTVWRHRDIIEHIRGLRDGQIRLTSPSIGLVNKVVRALSDEAYLKPGVSIGSRKGVTLADPIGMLRAFSKIYRFDRIERLNMFTLKSSEDLATVLRKFDVQSGGGAAYAVFSAADRLAPAVRQNKTWLMVSEQLLKNLVEATHAKEVDSGENFVVLVPEDDGVFYLCEGFSGSMRTTNAVQTYLDLMSVGGRGADAADALLRQCLAPAWANAGLLS